MSHRRRQFCPLCLAAAAALVVCPAAASAQTGGEEEGPIILNQPRETENKLHLDPADYTLTLEGVYQHSKVSSGNTTTTTDEYLLTQQVGFATHGYIVHPNFIELNIAADFGLSEDYTTTEGESSTSENPIYDWDLSATLLRNGEWPLTLYSTRQQSWIFRDFGSAIDSNTTQTGLRLDHTANDLTTHLDGSHLTSNQTGQESSDNLQYTQERFSWYSMYRPAANQTLNWTYDYTDTQESGAVTDNFTTQTATLNHEAYFGDNRQNTLQSMLNGSDQSGSTDMKQLSWTERLDLKHTDTFSTRYLTNVNRTDISGSTRTYYRGLAGFTHDLYKSLTTRGEAGLQQTDDSQGGGSHGEFADIDWTYRKQVPLGDITANLGFAWAEDKNDSSGAVDVVGQPGTFIDPFPIILTGGVDPNSIVIRDPSGLLLRPGIDYTVHSTPTDVQISRVVGGAISDLETVSMDYTRDPQPANTVTTDSFYTGLRYNFQQGPLNGLSLYVHYAKQDQSISSSSPTFNFTPNSFNDLLYGTEYRVGELTVGAEHQNHDSTIFPYDASRFWGRYLHSVGDTSWSLNTAYTTINYPAQGASASDRDDLYTIAARLDHQFNTRLSGNATVLWRTEQDDLNGNTEGFEEQLELQWNYRQVQAYLQLRASQLRTDSENNQFEFVRIGVQRRF